MKYAKIAFLAMVLLLLVTTTVSADAPYKITLYQFHGTGETTLSSASFGLQGTVTWTGMGQTSSGSYVLTSGFYPAVVIKSQYKIYVPLTVKNAT